MPTRKTKPAVAIRRDLHRRGLRFRVHRSDLPGTPDTVLGRAALAAFVDGCFWHGCPEHGMLPTNNREWWRKKLDGDRASDGAKDAALASAGFAVMHFWEHENPLVVADTIEWIWRQRTGRPARP